MNRFCSNIGRFASRQSVFAIMAQKRVCRSRENDDLQRSPKNQKLGLTKEGKTLQAALLSFPLLSIICTGIGLSRSDEGVRVACQISRPVSARGRIACLEGLTGRNEGRLLTYVLQAGKREKKATCFISLFPRNWLFLWCQATRKRSIMSCAFQLQWRNSGSLLKENSKV